MFSRISYEINGVNLCITAPQIVAQGKKQKELAYLSLCSLNLSTQRWKLKDNVFYSIDGYYSLKDDGDFLYAAQFSDASLDTHTLDPSMKEWANTKVTPASLNIAMYLTWEAEGVKYYVDKGFSSSNFNMFYYNPLGGHIAKYNPLALQIECLYSDVGTNEWA